MEVKNIREIIHKKKIELRLRRTILKEKIKNKFYQLINISKIKEYVKYKNNRKAKGVIYTCITGGYDNLKTHKYINLDWDYVCFTDEKNMKTDRVWDVRPLVFNKMDISRNNRWHKMHPHLLFPEYENSLYIDGNIRILSQKFFENLESKKESLFISTLHPKRNCLYEEAKICSEAKMEKKEIIDKQIEIIKGDLFSLSPNFYIPIFLLNLLYFILSFFDPNIFQIYNPNFCQKIFPFRSNCRK